jgi:uncharacterized protein (DUF952 family)
VIFHLALPDEWAAAHEAGEYRRSTLGRSLEDEGFVHCSYAAQVRDTYDAFYVGRGEVALLTIDPARLGGAEVREEGGFPHVYGPIPLAAVVQVVAYP